MDRPFRREVSKTVDLLEQQSTTGTYRTVPYEVRMLGIAEQRLFATVSTGLYAKNNAMRYRAHGLPKWAERFQDWIENKSVGRSVLSQIEHGYRWSKEQSKRLHITYRIRIASTPTVR
mmetsp:Transcript_24594/g.53875  ORF Transcript_24594/g.53875 Transcript_24594/m.53875 type:complete len:118 (+) Transcript_24594:475-828(+)